MGCEHDYRDQTTACADGLCPLCLSAALADARADVARLTEENALLRRTVVMLTRHGTDGTQEVQP